MEKIRIRRFKPKVLVKDTVSSSLYPNTKSPGEAIAGSFIQKDIVNMGRNVVSIMDQAIKEISQCGYLSDLKQQMKGKRPYIVMTGHGNVRYAGATIQAPIINVERIGKWRM